MKKLFKISLLVVAVIFIQAGDLVAQKYGYVNSTLILSELPESKQMDVNLQALSEQLKKKGTQMLTAYRQKEEAAMKEKERGTLSPVEEEKILAELQEKQQELMTFEGEMQNDLVAKRNELLNPILEKMNTAIQEVAKENGYKMIFDSQVLLYAEEDADLSAKVRAKLGI